MSRCCSSNSDDGWMVELLLEAELGGGEADCKGSKCSKKRMRHIKNERQRRILMNSLLDSLQSLLPDPHPRKDRCALLTEVIAHVRSLEEEIHDLQARTTQMKQTKPKLMHATSNGVLSEKLITANLRNVHVHLMQATGVSEPWTSTSNGSKEVIFTFTSSTIHGLLTHILALCQKNHIEVINATCMQSTTQDAQMLYYIHGQVSNENSLQSNELKSLFLGATFQEIEALE